MPGTEIEQRVVFEVGVAVKVTELERCRCGRSRSDTGSPGWRWGGGLLESLPLQAVRPNRATLRVTDSKLFAKHLSLQ